MQFFVVRHKNLGTSAGTAIIQVRALTSYADVEAKRGEVRTPPSIMEAVGQRLYVGPNSQRMLASIGNSLATWDNT